MLLKTKRILEPLLTALFYASSSTLSFSSCLRLIVCKHFVSSFYFIDISCVYFKSSPLPCTVNVIFYLCMGLNLLVIAANLSFGHVLLLLLNDHVSCFLSILIICFSLDSEWFSSDIISDCLHTAVIDKLNMHSSTFRDL